MDPKVRGIVAYITLIGWIVAVATNNPKDPLASFHIRQMLGIMLGGLATFVVSFVLMFIPILGWLVVGLCYIALLVFWILGFIGALQGEEKKVPLVGDYFQQWFKAL